MGNTGFSVPRWPHKQQTMPGCDAVRPKEFASLVFFDQTMTLITDKGREYQLVKRPLWGHLIKKITDYGRRLGILCGGLRRGLYHAIDKRSSELISEGRVLLGPLLGNQCLNGTAKTGIRALFACLYQRDQ